MVASYTKKRARTSFKLDELNNDQSFNAYDIVNGILNSNLSIPLEDSDTKLIVSIPPGNLSFDDNKRTISGYVKFYHYRELADEDGVDALINRSRRAPNLKNRTDDATEQAVVDYAVSCPAHGQHRTSNKLRKKGVFISGSGVRSVWLRHSLENFKKRLKALEEKVAREGIELTDTQITTLERKDSVVGPWLKRR